MQYLKNFRTVDKSMSIDNILNDIQTQGFSLQENLFSEEVINELRSEIQNAYHNNSVEYSLQHAGIGKNANLQKTIRGDKIHWLTKEKLNQPQKILWDFLETIKTQFNQKLFLGIKDFETHVTVYPENTFYKMHIDQFKNTNGEKIRKISFVIYLNQDWKEADGGELRLFDSDQKEIIKTIAPENNSAIFFLSDEFPHEVLETKKERISITGWFHT
jgi:SM-20-related protein